MATNDLTWEEAQWVCMTKDEYMAYSSKTHNRRKRQRACRNNCLKCKANQVLPYVFNPWEGSDEDKQEAYRGLALIVYGITSFGSPQTKATQNNEIIHWDALWLKRNEIDCVTGYASLCDAGVITNQEQKTEKMDAFYYLMREEENKVMIRQLVPQNMDMDAFSLI